MRRRKTIRRQLKALRSSARQFWRRLSGLRKTGIVTAAIAIFVVFAGALSFAGDFFGAADRLCANSPWFGACRSVGIGRVPTLAEEAQWAAATKGTDCEAFEQIYARQGFYSAQAKARFDLATYPTVPKPLVIPRTSPPTDPRPSEAEAASLAIEAANADAKQACETFEQSTGKQLAPSRFQSTAPPRCERYSDGFVCTMSGKAICSFAGHDAKQVCPVPAK